MPEFTIEEGLNQPIGETPEQRASRETIERYAALFGSQVGRKVLADILYNICHFGVLLNTNDPAEISAYNTGLIILTKAGYLKRIDALLGIAEQ